MKLETSEDLSVDQFRDIYCAETQVVKALPKIASAAHWEGLSADITERFEQMRGQVERLNTIFESLEATPRGKKCKAMDGLIEEGKELIREEPIRALRTRA